MNKCRINAQLLSPILLCQKAFKAKIKGFFGIIKNNILIGMFVRQALP